MKQQQETGQFLPLSAAALHILLALAGDELHGYGIMLEAARQSCGKYKLGPGTLYGAITRLEERGWIRVVGADERRRPYRLTAEGRRHLNEQLSSLERVVKTGLHRLKPI